MKVFIDSTDSSGSYINDTSADTVDEFFDRQEEYNRINGIRCSTLKAVIKNQDINKDVYSKSFSKGNLLELLLCYDIDEVVQFYVDNNLVIEKEHMPTGQYLQAIHSSNYTEWSIYENYRRLSNSRSKQDTVLNNIKNYQKYIDAAKNGMTSYIIEQNEFMSFVSSVQKEKDNKIIKQYIEGGKYQVIATRNEYSKVNNITLKCMTDVIKDNILVDIKFTSVQSINELRDVVRRFRYDMQMAFYKYIFEEHGYNLNPVLLFWFKNRPLVIELTEFDLEIGRYGLDINTEVLSYNDYIVRKNIFGFETAIDIYLQMKNHNASTIDDLLYTVKQGIFKSNIYGKDI